MTIKILLADDHKVVVEGLRAVFKSQPDFSVVGDVRDGAQVIDAILCTKPNVVVIDLQLPGVSGMEVMRLMHKADPGVRFVVLSMWTSIAYVVESLHTGALGFVRKSDDTSELIAAVRAAAAGKRYLSSFVSESEVNDYEIMQGTKLDLLEKLTQREREVFNMVAQGLSSQKIALKMRISKRTVDTHRTRLMEKLNVHSISELLIYAAERGILIQQDAFPDEGGNSDSTRS